MNVLEIVSRTLAHPRFEVEKKSPAFWPSEGGIVLTVDNMQIREGGCNRRMYYRFLDYPKDGRGMDLRGAVSTTTGHTLQGIFTEALKKARVYLADETPIQVTRRTASGIRYYISGSIDITIQDPNDPEHGRPWFLECKSMNPWKAKQYCEPTKGGKLEPRVSDVLQVFPYLDWARTVAGVEDPESHIIYVAQDGSCFGEQVVKFGPNDCAIIENQVGRLQWDDVTLGALYADFDKTAEAIKARQVPDRPYTVQYSNERLAHMLKHGDLNKTDAAVVQKRIQDGYQGPYLEKGDWQCAWCPFLTGCYNGFQPDRQRVSPIREDISLSQKVEMGEDTHVV